MIVLTHHTIGIANVIVDRSKFKPLVLKDVSDATEDKLRAFFQDESENLQGERRTRVLFVDGVDTLLQLGELLDLANLQCPIVVSDSYKKVKKLTDVDIIDASQGKDGSWELYKLTIPNFNQMLVDTSLGWSGVVRKQKGKSNAKTKPQREVEDVLPVKKKTAPSFRKLVESICKGLDAEQATRFRKTAVKVLLQQKSIGTIKKKLAKYGYDVNPTVETLIAFMGSKPAKRLRKAHQSDGTKKSIAAFKVLPKDYHYMMKHAK